MKKTTRFFFLMILGSFMTAGCMVPERRNTCEGLNSILWVRTSAEYSMLATQAYDRARVSIEKALTDPDWTAATEQVGTDFQELPPAVIVDIDETVLDTTAFQAQMIRSGQRFSLPLWNAWVKTAAAGCIPGSREFLVWATAEKKITVFYITNRDVSVEPYTRKNLQSWGIPVKEDIDAVLSKGDCGAPSSDKSARRRHVCDEYRVLLLAGDDLGDFISGAGDTPEHRIRAARAYASFWTDKWILLPNPIYGSWERAVYGHDSDLTDTEIMKRKIERLR